MYEDTMKELEELVQKSGWDGVLVALADLRVMWKKRADWDAIDSGLDALAVPYRTDVYEDAEEYQALCDEAQED